MGESTIYTVDAVRLAWPGRNQKRNSGTADIHSSYSGDTIVASGKVRKPFQWQGSLWIALGLCGGGGVPRAYAYRLVPIQLFEGATTTYAKSSNESRNLERASHDPRGLHHGIRVTYDCRAFVFCGPEVTFVAEGLEEERLASPADLRRDRDPGQNLESGA
jgi:hypothetical protein